MFKNDFDPKTFPSMAKTGWAVVSYQIEGFKTTTDSLKVYVQRRSSEQESPNWFVSVSLGNAWGDTKEVEDDGIAAALNFTKAVEDAVQLVKHIRETMLEELEAAYQARLVQYGVGAEAKRRAREADLPMTNQTAKNLLRRVADTGERVRLYRRGAEFDQSLLENIGVIERVKYCLDGKTIGRKALMQKLLSGEFSNRYKIA